MKWPVLAVSERYVWPVSPVGIVAGVCRWYPCLTDCNGLCLIFRSRYPVSLLARIGRGLLTNEKARSPFGLCWNWAAPGSIRQPMIPLPDEELARRAGQAGDDESFAELFARYRMKVFHACRGFFSDSQAAEDATQETFLRAYRNIRGFHQGYFSGWLMRIAKNVCIDEWRRSRRETGIDEIDLAELPSPNRLDSSCEARLMAERVWQEMRLLPSEQRQCLELKIEGFSYEETSERTGLTIGAVKSHIQNGRRMLWRKTVGALAKS